MEPITNSVVKERIRLRIEDEIGKEIYEINCKANEEIYKLKPKNLPDPIGWGCLGLILACGTFGIGFLVCLLGYHIHKAAVEGDNEAIEIKKKKIRADADAKIAKLKQTADLKTRKEILAYDTDVQRHVKSASTKTKELGPMVAHVAMMFERMISHADKGTNKRFIEAYFTFEVTKTMIIYHYQSTYTNSNDNYDFDKNRYKLLTEDAECEALAQVLTVLSTKKVIAKYPANSVNINVTHNDAKVTIHFKAANPNFINSIKII